MRTSRTIQLHGELNKQRELCIWGTGELGELIPSDELKLLILAVDKDTYYGANARVWEEGPVNGVILTPTVAFRYLLEPGHNRLVRLEWSEGLATMRGAAIEAADALDHNYIVPDISRGQLGWKLSDHAPLRQYPSLTKHWDDRTVIAEWVDNCIYEAVQQSESKKATLDRLAAWLNRAEDNDNGMHNLRLPEQALISLSGWTTRDCPFTSGFRLEEPADEESGWKLVYILVDRTQPALVIDCDASGNPMTEIPLHWEDYIADAAQWLSAWLLAIPFLGERYEEDDHAQLNEQDAWIFLTNISGQITDWGGIVLLPAWWNRLRAARPRLKAELRSGDHDTVPAIVGMETMLAFDWKLSVGDLELTEEEFLEIAEQQKPLHRIRGQWVALDQQLAEQIRKVMARARRKKGVPLRDVLLRQFGERDSVDGEQEQTSDSIDWEIRTGGHMLRWLNQLERKEGFPSITVSDKFQGLLRPYQAEGLSWLVYMRRFSLGCCLADDMGLGKTIQFITYLLHVKEAEPSSGPSLLICPTSLIGNWQKELERFAPDLRVHLHYGGDRVKHPEAFAHIVQNCDIVLTTYMTAMLDIETLRTIDWNALCLDEAQNMKNAYTKQASAIRGLSAFHRIALTGTPLENRLSELWSIMDFVNPGYLGSASAFGRQYGKLAQRDKERALLQLRRLIRPFIMRRMKTDSRIVPDLPDKIESKLYVPLTKEQAAHYENVLERLFNRLEERSRFERRGHILSALTQLKQICDHPALFTKESSAAAQSPRHSHKAARLLEMVGELRAENDRCLIFTQYVEMGAMLERMLGRALKEPVLYLHGGTTKQQRDRMVEQFQKTDSGPGIFILSLKAGGTGLNLTAASHVFHYDRWWNPAVENQATDRAHRIGQSRLVQVHKFIALGTLEERIDAMIERKLGLSREIIDAGEQWLTELSSDDLHDLIKLRRDWVESR